jgi:hypothetical protein
VVLAGDDMQPGVRRQQRVGEAQPAHLVLPRDEEDGPGDVAEGASGRLRGGPPSKPRGERERVVVAGELVQPSGAALPLHVLGHARHPVRLERCGGGLDMAEVGGHVGEPAPRRRTGGEHRRDAFGMGGRQPQGDGPAPRPAAHAHPRHPGGVEYGDHVGDVVPQGVRRLVPRPGAAAVSTQVGDDEPVGVPQGVDVSGPIPELRGGHSAVQQQQGLAASDVVVMDAQAAGLDRGHGAETSSGTAVRCPGRGHAVPAAPASGAFHLIRTTS